MYLERMPRYKDATAKDVNAVESYLSWVRSKEEGSEYANCTFEEWCGIKNIPTNEYIDFYSKFYEKKYADWDTEHKYGHYHICDEVGYWRKANQIHNWFVENIQDGIDDCDYHREVTREDLEELLDICERVYNSSHMILGLVKNGATLINGEWVNNMEMGKRIIDPSVAKELLPTSSGFFFGGTDYDEYYVQDIEHTIDIITQVLETTDFETQMIYYCSSW